MASVLSHHLLQRAQQPAEFVAQFASRYRSAHARHRCDSRGSIGLQSHSQAQITE
jgi:hypothetical protein